MNSDGNFDISKNPAHADVLLDLSPNLVIFLDPDNIVCKISKIARHYFSPDDSIDPVGMNIYSLVKHPVLSLFMKKWGEKLNKGIEIDETFPLDLHQSGQYEWFQVRAKNVDYQGRLVGKVYFISNITELYSQKKILDTLMSSFPGDVLVFDRALQVLLVSDAIARQNGYHSWRDVSGRTLHELPRLDVHFVESMLDRVTASEEPIHEVVKRQRGQKEIRWYYVDVRTINSTAGVFGYIMTQFDITGEIKPKAILEAIMDSSSDAISIVNPEGVVEYASKVLVNALGIADWRAVINHPWPHLFRSTPRDAGGFAELFSGSQTEPRQGTLSVDTAEGKSHFNYRTDPLNYQSENFGMITVSTNMTELVAARDRAESAVRAKAAFLANMSHELRTPMNAVIGMNELLSRTPLTPLQKNYTMQIRSSATLLLSIINEILDYSRMEDRKLGLNNAPYHTVTMLQDVLNQVALKVFEKELALTVDIDPAIPSMLIGDEIRVRQILINLLNNAVKFTERGEVNLSVSLFHISERKSALLVFKVRDTGIGIPKDRQAELFERFSRIESGQANPVEGSGLGLSICKGLVSLMNGSIAVESEAGGGSVFTVRITQAVPPQAEPIASFSSAANATLLVFESDAPTLASIRQMCAYAGIRADFCVSPGQFAEKLSAARFVWTHVIFDYRDGYPAALETVKLHPSVRWLALLAMTDFVSTEKDPAVGFIFKPLFITTFARFLRGERVDLSLSLPLAGGLGLSPTFFRANGVNVLVVDDNAVNRKVAEGFLRTLDIQVEEAESGAKAIEKAGATVFDLVLVDHLMPEMDGLETAARLRRLPGYHSTPILALTANGGNGYREMYRKAGMNDVVRKPIDFNDFAVCLKKWLPAEKLTAQAAEPPLESAARPEDASAPFSASGEWIPGLDREAGIGFTGSLQNLETILRVFGRTGPKMLDQLEAGRRSGNAAQFRTAVHSLISSCANIGGVRLSAMARELEQAILSGSTESIDRLYPDVHEELEKTIGGVHDYLKGLPAAAMTNGGKK